MNYPFLLKFSGISNLSDARYAAGMWADFIGFCFDPNQSQYIEPAKAKEIAAWINGPMVVGEFGNQPLEWVMDFVEKLNLKTIQIPANYKDSSILDKGLKLIVMASEYESTPIIDAADIIITDSLETYRKYSQNSDKSLMLQSNNPPENAGEFDGIALLGEKEEKPGTRNQKDWTEFLERYAEED